MNRKRIEVTIIESPITSRYVQPGSKGFIDETIWQIRVGGTWFDYEPRKWKVVTEEGKESKFLEMFKESMDGHNELPDHKFVSLVESFAITEERAMEWMIKDKNIHRKSSGWWYKAE